MATNHDADLESGIDSPIRRKTEEGASQTGKSHVTRFPLSLEKVRSAGMIVQTVILR